MGSNLSNIIGIAVKLGISGDDYETYGKYMAKLSINLLNKTDMNNDGKLILVTAITPTPSGEGKTTTTIGLAQALSLMGKRVAAAIREPSLGPCFGIKGGATGGGRSTVEPSDRINLTFTGDFPSISAAHNLLSSIINNHIYHGNKLGIDVKRIVFPRTIDMNDRSLRNIIVGVGNRDSGVIYNDSFVITPASEIMAIVGLSLSYADMKNRLGNIIVGYTHTGKPVYARDLKVNGAMSAILRDALLPNLVQTQEGVPAFIHTGPFGNIAHGTSSVIADKIALKVADYVVTEAGFGSDLGAEKFFNIVSRTGNIPVDAVVIVATIGSLKHHGGASDTGVENLDALTSGVENLLRHVNIIRSFGYEPVVAINRFSKDTANEISHLSDILIKNGIEFAITDVFVNGGAGGMDLAGKVLESISRRDKTKNIKYTYDLNESVKSKIDKIGKLVYGASAVEFSKESSVQLEKIKELGMDNLPVCMAKTQYSLSDDPALLNSPKNFTIHVHKITISAGAGYIVAHLGDIMTMPGLPKVPNAEHIDLTDNGEIVGLM